MDIVDLKNKILDKSIDDSFMIWIYSDNTFLSMQYVDEICKIRNRKRLIVSSIAETQSNDDDIFDSNDQYLYVVLTDEFKEVIDSSIFKNVIVITKKLNPEVKLDYIEIPELKSWQVVDYVQTFLPGLNKEKCSWLCEICSYNIYRIQNEIDKIKLFPEGSQDIIFDLINDDNGYSDLTHLTIFNFTAAFLKKDLKAMAEILSDLETIDVEATGVVTLLIKNLKQIIDIQMNANATAESLKLSPKQVYAIRKNCGIFTNDQLINMYDFLTEIDYRLKNGELTLDDNANHLKQNNKLVDYLTCKLIGILR